MKRIFFITFIVLSLIILLLIYNLFFNINNIPEGEFLYSSNSPNGNYVVNIYLVESTLSSNSIRGEIVNNKTGKRRNIYWQYGRSYVTVEWIDDQNVAIDGIILNVQKGKFDFRVDSKRK